MMDVIEKEGQMERQVPGFNSIWFNMAGSEEEERKSGGGSKPNGIETKVIS